MYRCVISILFVYISNILGKVRITSCDVLCCSVSGTQIVWNTDDDVNLKGWKICAEAWYGKMPPAPGQLNKEEDQASPSDLLYFEV